MAKVTKRDDELSTKRSVRERLLDVFKEVEAGFVDQRERANDIQNYWDMYNCKLNERQFYNGNSQIYVPIVQNAVEARKTRFTNQIFPQSGRYVEVTTGDAELPEATMSLAEHWVRRAKLRTQVVPALIVAGDIEGQYSVYVGWQEFERHTVSRETKPVQVGGAEFSDLGTTTKFKKETIKDGRPFAEVIADSDLLVMPQTVDSLEEAIEVGGSITIKRRWTKTKIEKMRDDGDFEEAAANALIKSMSKKEGEAGKDIRKRLADDAGIRQNNSGKYVIGYETWTKLKIDGKYRICRAYYGGNDQILGCKLNPYWCDRVPVISGPVKKTPGVFKGRAPVADVQDLQLFANDMANEGADTAHFSAMPIIMTDPLKEPNIGSMILGLAAIWQTNPKDTQFAQFPPIWEKAFTVIGQIKSQIFESLGVNPAMIPQQTGGKNKRNQAEIANEQQVDILTTADSVTNIEEQILSPLVEWFVSLDHQFREDDILIRTYGEMGMRATMETVEPIQELNRHEYRWFGVEAARGAAQIQQQIGTFGVLQKIPPNMYQGYRIDAVPIITSIVENVFGPRLGPRVFKSLKDELTVDPQIENEMLLQGFDMAVHPMDDDPGHIQVHQQALEMDARGNVKVHIQKHMQQMQQKQQAQAMQQAQQQQQQGGGRGPQPGSSPRGPTGGKQPPGAIHADRMARAGSVQMPRKT